MNVRDAIPTIEDYKLLMTHIDASIKESFDKAIHLFVINDDVHNHNDVVVSYNLIIHNGKRTTNNTLQGNNKHSP